MEKKKELQLSVLLRVAGLRTLEVRFQKLEEKR